MNIKRFHIQYMRGEGDGLAQRPFFTSSNHNNIETDK